MAALCWQCAEDRYLSDCIRADGKRRRCSECGRNRFAWTAKELGEQLAPIIREHFSPGDSVKQFGANDEEWYEQEGEPLPHVIETVVGQYLSFHDELCRAVADTEAAGKPYDFDDPFFETGTNYVENPVYLGEFADRWNHLNKALHESPSLYGENGAFHAEAKAFLDELLGNVHTLRAWNEEGEVSVVRELEVEFVIWRGRRCLDRELVSRVIDAQGDELGAPPREGVRASRMNRAGTSVFYGALDCETCLAEMRPSIGGETVLARFLTTTPLRVLDFGRLEDAWEGFSYFDPTFPLPRERAHFLRALHDLVAQPVAAGKEAEYAITQALAEYLGRVIAQPVDGVIYKSVQREDGTNIVLFGTPDEGSKSGASFPVAAMPDSVELHRTCRIEYEHEQIDYTLKPGAPEPFFFDFRDV